MLIHLDEDKEGATLAQKVRGDGWGHEAQVRLINCNWKIQGTAAQTECGCNGEGNGKPAVCRQSQLLCKIEYHP